MLILILEAGRVRRLGRANSESWRLTDGGEASHGFVLFELFSSGTRPRRDAVGGQQSGANADNYHDGLAQTA